MQLERGSVEVLFPLSDRLEEEDKIVVNEYETLNSTVERLSREVVNLKKGKMESAASAVATSSWCGRSTIGNGAPGARSGTERLGNVGDI